MRDQDRLHRGQILSEAAGDILIGLEPDLHDLARLEAQARAMAMVFGIDPDRPYPEALRLELQSTGAFRTESWALSPEAPAWWVLARELALTSDLGEGEF